MPVAKVAQLRLSIRATRTRHLLNPCLPMLCLQVVSIKSKFMLLNDTGLPIEFKQAGTPDPGDQRILAYGAGRRFAGVLQPSQR